MIDSLTRVLIENELDPDSFTAPEKCLDVFRGEVAAGRVMQTWVSLAKASAETKYWPIIRGSLDDIHELKDQRATEILAAAPAGKIDEILHPLFLERKNSLCAMLPEFDAATDMYQLAAMVDASGIYSFGGRQMPESWPAEPAHQRRVSLHTLRKRKGKPSVLLLIKVEHSYEVPAYLQFGGWNDCPTPELQVAVLREWGNEYRARPACTTGDVVECVVVNRPQKEAEAMKLAAQQWIFCADIVAQGTQSIRKLAMEIWKAPTWFFWWD
jgi:hypothetical protein